MEFWNATQVYAGLDNETTTMSVKFIPHNTNSNHTFMPDLLI